VGPVLGGEAPLNGLRVIALCVVLRRFALLLDNRQVPRSRAGRWGTVRGRSDGLRDGMGYRFNPPPNWPAPPPGWVPPTGWRPSPEWPAPPQGWQLWIDDMEPAPSQSGTVHQHARHTGQGYQEHLGDEGDPGRHAGKKSWLARIAARTDLRGLGVRIEDGQVSTLPGLMKSRHLGPLKGAHAEVTAGTRHHRIGAAAVAAPLSLGAGLIIGLTKKSKATAFVVFAEGSVQERKLDGASMISTAQRDAVRFNALAAAKEN
jgi:hypothetical protein